MTTGGLNDPANRLCRKGADYVRGDVGGEREGAPAGDRAAGAIGREDSVKLNGSESDILRKAKLGSRQYNDGHDRRGADGDE